MFNMHSTHCVSDIKLQTKPIWVDSVTRTHFSRGNMSACFLNLHANSTLSDEIQNFRSTEETIYALIDQDRDIDDELRALDAKLQESFEDITTADLTDPTERYQRMEFLLSLICNNSEKSEYVDNLSKLLLNDMKNVTGVAKDNKRVVGTSNFSFAAKEATK